MDKIILPQNIKIGHAQTDKTGVTVIMCEEGAVAGVDVRGCAPGTRETDLLAPEKAIEKINAVVFCGGSAYGLGACDGVMQYLRENNFGHKMGQLVVPLVSGAVIYDLSDNAYNFPTQSMGYEAAKNAKNVDIKFGKTGAGTGATIGKILGPKFCARGGIGASTIQSNGLFVTAVSLVNALGDVYDHRSGQLVSGAKGFDGQFLNTHDFIISGQMLQLMQGKNTTLSCVITNAKLTKLQAKKLASISHDGFALSIRPVHTDYDGDTIFALSCGDVPADFTMLSSMAVEAVCRSIVNAVK